MKNSVYIKKTCKKYNNKEKFNPSERYKEGLNVLIQSDSKIYDDMRQLFINMGFDRENIGTKNWNPFRDFIKPGYKVIIKPNLVTHINNCKNGDMDCLITNFSVIRPIIDYTILALDGRGQVIVGDAPVQECNFDDVIKHNNLKEAIEIYKKSGFNIDLKDFRKNQNVDLVCREIKVNEYSSFKEVDKYYKKFGIMNYDLKILREHHNDSKHEYLFPQEILDADVIINMPKVKTHRIAGITACMKNFVGANAKKEYLPHHRNGSIHSHGDEYPERSFIKLLCSKIKNYNYLHSKFLKTINLGLMAIRKIVRKNKYQLGMWYGNDTIWRTILDINKAILYASKNGVIQMKKQRIIFNVADMVVCGEGEGPLLPSRKEVGLIVCGFNQLNVDAVICNIMGFDSSKIKYINNGYKLTKLKISMSNKFNIYDEFGKVQDIKKYNNDFKPAKGWKDYLN